MTRRAAAWRSGAISAAAVVLALVGIAGCGYSETDICGASGCVDVTPPPTPVPLWSAPPGFRMDEDPWLASRLDEIAGAAECESAPTCYRLTVVAAHGCPDGLDVTSELWGSFLWTTPHLDTMTASASAIEPGGQAVLLLRSAQKDGNEPRADLVCR